MRKVAIIQARMRSERLPGKVLLPLAGKPMLEHIVERAKKARLVDQVVVAIPDDPEHEIEKLCHLSKTPLYMYSFDDNDLIGRYYMCAEHFKADTIIRLCGDNPLVEPSEIDRAIELYLECSSAFLSESFRLATFVSNMHQHLESMMLWRTVNGYPDGIGCEVFSSFTIKWLDKNIKDAASREHLHKYFHDEGLIESPICPPEFSRPDLKLDVNTQKDYEFIKDIFDNLYPQNPNFGIKEVIAYLDKKNMVERGV